MVFGLMLQASVGFACQKRLFDKVFFEVNSLPRNFVSYRYDPCKQVSGAELQTMVEGFVDEVIQKKEPYKNFTVLQKRDFNQEDGLGLLILKCKKHPFVIKFFRESREGLFGCSSRGFVANILSHMNGGVSNHMIGFSRIKNLEFIKNKIVQDSELKERLSTPRKWFLLPKQNRWLEISNDDGQSVKQILKIPDTYCIVSDFVEGERASFFNSNHRDICMAISNEFKNRIDANPKNFLFESRTGKVAIIDTENFLVMTGTQKGTFPSYLSWVASLTTKAITSVLGFNNKCKI